MEKTKKHGMCCILINSQQNLVLKKLLQFREIFKTVTEHYPGKPSELKEELGIEEDPIPFEQDPLQSNV